jgi:microsomal dipeptidase-like Zn-dependent dipeptidase
MSNYFADIHCHSTLKYAFDDDPDLWDSKGIPNSTSHITGIYTFSQCDFRRMAKGNVQVAVLPIIPIEQKQTVLADLLDKVEKVEDFLEGFAAWMTKIPKKKFDFLQSVDYDHYQQMMYEVQLILNKQTSGRKVKLGNKDRRNCSYKVVANGAEIDAVLAKNKADDSQYTIAVVLSVEGGHSLGCGHVNFDGKKNKYNVDEATLLARVDGMKGLASKEATWKISPLWITLAHAFGNDHFGNAQALVKMFRKPFKHSEEYGEVSVDGMLNKGINATGKKIIERLLNLDQVKGKRILIDIKHLSTQSRRDYYDIIDAHNKANPTDLIPVIMSHAAVNGSADLSRENYNPNDSEDLYDKSDTFNPWSINLFNDEVIKIHETKGMMGLIFDQRVLSSKAKIKTAKKAKGKKDENDDAWCQLIADQIEHVVKLVFAHPDTKNKAQIWDCISIGSDLDGQINPIDAFYTSKDFEDFECALARHLNTDRFKAYRGTATGEQLARKICAENALDFIKQHYK